MKEVINKAMISLQLSAKNQGVTLENNLPRDLPCVWADREKILQVVTNLLENAIKFNKQNGKVSIFSSKTHSNNRIAFCVSDTGIGIEKDKIEKIFERFYVGEPLEGCSHRGCGLGLAICKSILELHQGKIWVESKAGMGSKFFFELNKSPLAPFKD